MNLRHVSADISPRGALGFTLVELLVTLSVAVIVLAIAVPSFAALVATNRVSVEANRLVAGLNYARAEAVRRNQPVYVCSANLKDNFDVQGCLDAAVSGQKNWGEGLLLYADAASGGTTASYDSNESVKVITFLGENGNKAAINLVMSTSPVGTTNQIAFGSDGRLMDGSNRKFLLRDTANSLCRVILINGSGRAQVCDSASDSSCGACS